MQLRHRLTLIPAAAGAFVATPAAAQTVDLTIALPRMTVAEYNKPYVAVWVEGAGIQPRTLSIWYDVGMKKGEGQKWLRDVRQWWRKSGRALKLPADGVSGATKAPGTHKLSYTAGRGPLGTLAPGQYTLVVEAAREVGGLEVVRLPFAWPPKPGQTARAAGKAELGAVTASFKR